MRFDRVPEKFECRRCLPFSTFGRKGHILLHDRKTNNAIGCSKLKAIHDVAHGISPAEGETGAVFGAYNDILVIFLLQHHSFGRIVDVRDAIVRLQGLHTRLAIAFPQKQPQHEQDYCSTPHCASAHTRIILPLATDV